ncbi:hypothetical protein ABMA27_008205 [Loxostege sticticalis]|uniref:Gustatory receptor n=2 Tax=Loxostege sticticalis TaxID=481309 RepID=A0ABR3HEC7_LOXSC
MKSGNSNFVSYHFLYKSIADVYDKVKVLYNPLYVVPLVFHTIDMMITIFYPLLQMDQQRTSPVDMLSANISVVQVFFLLFTPAFASGLLASQVEKLRLALLDRQLREKGENHTKDIERFIRYIEARPMKTVIYKVISLDWKLPVSVLNICVTYLIVMLQFTHKY